MPRLDQSGRRHVHFCRSKISTPLWMASILALFDVWKALSSSGVHVNLQRGLRKGLKGAMVSRSCA